METGLTERQKKWFASVREGLVRDTGKTLEQWAKVAQSCPETSHRARLAWLRVHHGLGVNRASTVLDAAFGAAATDQPQGAAAQLWAKPEDRAVRDALLAAVSDFGDVVVGERKTFTALSRRVQFAAARPVKGGVRIGLAVEPSQNPKLSPAKKNEGWSERCRSAVVVTSPKAIDKELKRLLKTAWAAS